MEPRIPARLTPREGRRFAFPVGAAFLGLAGIAAWRGQDLIASPLAAIGALLLLAGVLAPGRLGPVQGAWMGFGRRLSSVTNPVVLAVLYFAAIVPTGLLLRIFGRNPLERKLENDSYWVARESGAGRRSNLKRQF